jgi:hypothetical protein
MNRVYKPNIYKNEYLFLYVYKDDDDDGVKVLEEEDRGVDQRIDPSSPNIISSIRKWMSSCKNCSGKLSHCLP